MARTVQITAPTEQADELIQQIQQIGQVLDIKLFRAASVSPPGDLISVSVPNRCLNELMRLLDARGLGTAGGLSLSSSEMESYIPAGERSGIERDNNEATWEEMEMTIADDSNSSPNTLCTMFIAGALATIGVATNALHVAIAGMLVAPGFMPMVRVALGFVGRRRLWQYGLVDFAKGYATLLVGAAITAAALTALGLDPLNGKSTYYQNDQTLLEYWTTHTIPSTLSSLAAAAAGALLVATKRSVFTSGVMIGLALVPSAAIIAMGLVAGDFAIAFKALTRFALDVALVLLASVLVLSIDKVYNHRRSLKL